MNKLLIATAAVAFATVGTAGAADLPTKAPPMVAAAPVQTWTGCYVSGGIGYGMWNQDVSLTGNVFGPNGAVTTANTVTTTDGGRGWLGRVGVGCDYQVGAQFVFGAFADYDWSNIKGTNEPNEVFFGAVTSPVAFDVKERNAGNVGLRLGYLPYPNLMTFVSGGWTRARFTESLEYLTLTGAAVNAGYGDYNVNGWFIGGGTEYRLPWFQNLTWKTEYRFNQYQSVNLAEVTTGGLLTGNVVHNQSFVQTVTTSLVWRFNWGGPVVARY
jgi:outer membrane immunogenic protein